MKSNKREEHSPLVIDRYLNEQPITKEELEGFVVTNKNLLDEYTNISKRIDQDSYDDENKKYEQIFIEVQKLNEKLDDAIAHAMKDKLKK